MHRRGFREFAAARILENTPTATKADAEEVKKRRKRRKRSKEKKKSVKGGATRGAEGHEGRSKSRKTGSLLAPRGPFLLAFLHGGLSTIFRVKRRDAATSARSLDVEKSMISGFNDDGNISCKHIGFSHFVFGMLNNPCVIREHDRRRSSSSDR